MTPQDAAPAKDLMLKISLEPLVWTQRDDLYALCPITSTEYSIAHEEGKFWGNWFGAPVEGSADVQDVKDAAEMHRADQVLKHLRVSIESAPDTDPRLVKAWELGRDAAVAYHEKSEASLNSVINADDTAFSKDLYGQRVAGHNADAMMIRDIEAPHDLDAQVNA